MRLLAFATLPTALALGCLAQEPAPPAAGSPAITVPAGTKVPLRLTSPLGTKTARPGDAVHAEAAFPVTALNTVAIPPGTYLDGVIDQVTRRGSHAGFTMHFTHMVFTNGYTVSLSAATADTRAGLLPTGGMAFQSTTPTVSQPSLPGPSRGAIIGLGVGSAVAAAAAAVIFGRRGGDLYMRAGWRFEMVLADPLSLDAEKVAAAVANPTRGEPKLEGGQSCPQPAFSRPAGPPGPALRGGHDPPAAVLFNHRTSQTPHQKSALSIHCGLVRRVPIEGT